MIDYDDLRKRWTQAVESNKIAHFYTFASLPPEDGLRLLDIIAVAKTGLDVVKMRDIHHGKVIAFVDSILAEIVKLEKE